MDARGLDELMRTLAARQHSLVARDQLRARRVARQAVARRLESPDWEALTARVLRLVGAPVTGGQRALAAVLDAGADAVVSHRSAAALWGLPGFELRDLHLTCTHGRGRPTALAEVHHSRWLPAEHHTVRDAIPLTTLARTVVDLAAMERPARVELALHAAVRMGLAWSVVDDVIRELGAKGRSGIGLVRGLMLEGGGRPLGSGLEGRLLRTLAGAGLPRPRRQVDLGAGEWVGRVDFFYDDVCLVIEVDGAWHHEEALDVRRDKRRTAALTAAGFRVLPLSEDLIRHAPDEVVRLVREARRRASIASGQ